MATIAVDFDGVIHAYSKGWHDGSIYDPPIDGAFDALRELMEKYAVYIHTSRAAELVGAWLGDRGGFPVQLNLGDSEQDDLKFWNRRLILLVTNKKLPAVAYIDDRGIRFESWGQALADLARFEPSPVEG